MATKATNKATAKYKKAHYDRLAIEIAKGDREIIKEHAAKRGESVQQFVRRAIYAMIEIDRNFMVWGKDELNSISPNMDENEKEQTKRFILQEHGQIIPGKLLPYNDWIAQFNGEFDDDDEDNYAPDPSDLNDFPEPDTETDPFSGSWVQL